MAQEFKLDIFKRDALSKSSVKALRNENSIPGIFYSYNSKESIPFYIKNDTLNLAKKSGARIFNINVGDKKQTVIFKSIQYHPVTDEVMHIDLYGVNMDQEVTVKVQLLLTGSAAGVINEGGVLVQSLNEIEINCLPADIPENLEVDISSLNLGESLRAGDINLEEKFSLSTDEMQTIASVTQAMKEEVKAEEDEEGADSDTEAASDDSSDSAETSSSDEKAEGESEG